MGSVLDNIGFSPDVRESIEISRGLFYKEDSKKGFIRQLSVMLMDKTIELESFLNELKKYAGCSLLKDEMFYFLFYLENTEELFKRYKEQGISPEIFYDTLSDFKCKTAETLEVKGYHGIHCPTWYPRIFRLNLFALGRFQYEYAKFSQTDYHYGGITVENGSPVLSMHIPSSGSMDSAARLESYRKAYAFYRDAGYFTDGIMKVICNSWILYPPYREVYASCSNLAAFADEFQVISQTDLPAFGDGWRIFGSKYNPNHENLPENTSLQKGFARYLKGNDKYGNGYGIMLFDGERIVNKR